PARESAPEWGIGRGRLVPDHRVLAQPGRAEGGPAADGRSFSEALARSLVLVHGGMAQNVGPILNMVTEKYLLRGQGEWLARQEALEIFDDIVECVGRSDVRGLGRAT